MVFFTGLPASLRFRDPTVLVATWFGSGLLPKAPGTWGSLAGLPAALLLGYYGGPGALVAGALVAFVVGIPAATRYATATGKDDPSEIVIDEVAAQWLVLSMLPMTVLAWAVGFLLFRFFDVLKPWPVSLADRKLKGGFGIMLDDIIAAGYAMLVVLVLRNFIEGL